MRLSVTNVQKRTGLHKKRTVYFKYFLHSILFFSALTNMACFMIGLIIGNLILTKTI